MTSRAPRRRDLRQRPLARPPRLVVLAAVVIAVGAAVLMPRGWGEDSSCRTASPGLPNSDSVSVERLLAAAEEERQAWTRVPPKRAVRGAGGVGGAAPTVEEVAASLGPEAAPALVTALLTAGRRETVIGRSSTSSSLDFTRSPLAMALAARSTRASDAALLRAIRDPGTAFETKVEALIPLCRKADPTHEHDAARVRELVALVTATDTYPDVRQQAGLRLHRLESPLPPELRAVVGEPWHDLAGPVATALALCGDVLSVELLAAEVAQRGKPSMLVVDRVIAALRVLRRRSDFPAELQPRIDALVSAEAMRRGDGWLASAFDRADAEMNHLGPTVTAWAAALPDEALPAWDREMRARRRSPERRRALALTTAEAVAAADERDIDVAGATLCLLCGPDAAAQTLDRLDRLARRLRPAVEAAATPREKLAVIQHECVPMHQSSPMGADLSSLTVVLEHRAGICMGWTMLFVGLGERLNLPLHAVEVPAHVFVRWDDGTERFNFDPLLGGVCLSDDEYAANYTLPEIPLDRSRHLRALSRRQIVSLALSNTAAWGVFEHRLEEARRLAHVSAKLDRQNEIAWLNAFAALAPDGPPAADKALSLLDQAPPVRSSARALDIAVSLHWLGLGDESIRMLDAARALNPAGDARHALRAAALASAGRASDARVAVATIAPDDDGSRGDCESVLLALDLVESQDPGRLLDDRLRGLLRPATPGSQDGATADSPDRARATIDRLLFLSHLLLVIPPRTPDRARLAIQVLDRGNDIRVQRRLAMTDAARPRGYPHDLYEALRRYAEARAAEAAPSANPGAPGREK